MQDRIERPILDGKVSAQPSSVFADGGAQARSANAGSIAAWLAAIRSSDTADSLVALRRAYLKTPPRNAEFIVATGCGFAGKHCIYPASFPRFNSSLEPAQWRQILRTCANDLGMTTFVHGGRSLDRTGLTVLENLRADAPAARIGLIDNGISFRPFQSAVRDLGLDWIDVSLDGSPQDHDLQRGKTGAFDQGLDGAVWLLENDAAPRVNVLTCLTSINAGSVPDMIRSVHSLGFRNFYVTPVTVVNDTQPEPRLRLDAHSFSAALTSLEAASLDIDQAWLEVNFFGPEYLRALWQCAPGRAAAFEAGDGALTMKAQAPGDDSTTFRVNFFPGSLAGTREFIVNTNGDLVLPKAVSFGNLPREMVVGNVLASGAKTLLDNLSSSAAFKGYIDDLGRERDLLRPYLRR